jgi:small subunit ribosomal protein S3
MAGKIEVTIHTARPGLVIGKKGAEIEILKKELKDLTGKEIWIEVEEIKRADLDSKLVADGIAKQIERRIPFRRVLKKALQASMDAGAAGIKVQISGRVGGAEIARTEWYKEGRIPLHTLRADIDYATGRAETTYGSIGVKVWINKGEEAV